MRGEQQNRVSVGVRWFLIRNFFLLLALQGLKQKKKKKTSRDLESLGGRENGRSRVISPFLFFSLSLCLFTQGGEAVFAQLHRTGWAVAGYSNSSAREHMWEIVGVETLRKRNGA